MHLKEVLESSSCVESLFFLNYPVIFKAVHIWQNVDVIFVLQNQKNILAESFQACLLCTRSSSKTMRDESLMMMHC